MLTNLSVNTSKVTDLVGYSGSDMTTEIPFDMYYMNNGPIVCSSKDLTINGILDSSYLTEKLYGYDKNDCKFMLKYYITPAYIKRKDGSTDPVYIDATDIGTMGGSNPYFEICGGSSLIDKAVELGLYPSDDKINPYGIEIANGINNFNTQTYDSKTVWNPYFAFCNEGKRVVPWCQDGVDNDSLTDDVAIFKNIGTNVPKVGSADIYTIGQIGKKVLIARGYYGTKGVNGIQIGTVSQKACLLFCTIGIEKVEA